MLSVQPFLVLGVFTLTINSTSLLTKLHVIDGVQKYFRCNCVILLVQNRFEETALNNRIEVQLSKKLEMFGTVSLAAIADKYGVMQRTCSRPLLVMPNVDLRQIAVLATLPKRMRGTGPVWLIFLDGSFNLEMAFDSVYVPFDCEFIVAQSLSRNKGDGKEAVTLTEVYRVAAEDTILRTHPFGSWTEEAGFKGSDLTFFARRNNLHGLVIDAATVDDQPAVLVHIESNKSIIVGGTIGEHWRNAQIHLNFLFNARPPSVGRWGDQLDNGSWNGMVGMVVRKEVQCATNGFVMNPILINTVKYSMPMSKIYYGVYISELDGRDVSWSNFLTPFSPYLWLTVLFTTFSIAGIIYNIYYLHHGFSGTDAISASDAFFYIFCSVFSNQGHSHSPSAFSTRIVHFIVSVFSLVVVSSYLAFLTSSFTVIKPKIPFNSLEGLLKDGTYELGLQKGAYYGRYFQEAKSGLLKDIFDKHVILSSSPVTAIEGLSRVCSDQKYAFVAHAAAVRLVRGKLPCKIFEFPETFAKLSASRGFCQTDSPYQLLFNFYFLKQLEAGISDYAFARFSPVRPRPEKVATDGILLEQVTPILCIVVAGVVVGFLCLIGEQLARRMRTNKESRRSDIPLSCSISKSDQSIFVNQYQELQFTSEFEEFDI